LRRKKHQLIAQPSFAIPSKETLNKGEFLNFGEDVWLMTLQRPEKSSSGGLG
jgi:hypothetical protein